MTTTGSPYHRIHSRPDESLCEICGCRIVQGSKFLMICSKDSCAEARMKKYSDRLAKRHKEAKVAGVAFVPKPTEPFCRLTTLLFESGFTRSGLGLPALEMSRG